jgi:hypothetical protein
MPLFALLLALTAPRAPACDGVPPELHNQDASVHSYTLTCGKKTTERELVPTGKDILEGFSGCVLELGEQRETLHTEMVCTIATGGALSCDLL